MLKIYLLAILCILSNYCLADLNPTQNRYCVGDSISVDYSQPHLDTASIYLKGQFNTYRVVFPMGKIVGAGRRKALLPKWLPSGTYELFATFNSTPDTLLSAATVRVVNVVLSEVNYTKVKPVYIDGDVIYYKSLEQVGWPTARTNAESMGGVMATIRDSATNAFLTTFADSLGTWTAASDVKVEGAWRWLDESKLTATFWDHGEPNNAGNEDFATLKKNGKWNDKGRDTPLSYFMIIDLNFNRRFETVWGGDVKMIPPYITQAGFEWFGPSAFYAPDSTTELHNFTYPNQGTYFLKISKDGCTSQDLNFTIKTNSEMLDTALYGYAGALNGFDYYVSKYDLPFQLAYDQAIAKGGYLPDIRSQAENDMISALQESGTHVWIGLSDIGHRGTFTYTRDDSPLVYNNWNTGEPNQRPDEDYVLMWVSGKWNDIFPVYNNRFAIKMPKNISTDSISDFTFCHTSKGFVKFSAGGPYDATNQYIVELSNASGSFASPIELARGNRANDDTLGFTLPSNIPYGRDYRIRVTSTNPGIGGLSSSFKVRISDGQHLLPLLRTMGDTILTDFNPLYHYTWYINGDSVANNNTGSLIADTAATYVLKVEYNGCSATSTPLFFDPLAVPKGLGSDVRIFPNPARDVVRIESSQAQHIQIIDATGKTVLRIPMKGNASISLQALKPGVYYVRLTSVSAAAVYKVIKL